MPDATKHPLSTPEFHAKTVEVETGGVAIFRNEFQPVLAGGNFTELNCTVTCMVLKAKVNDRLTSSPLPR
ncbi:hypothetical protein TNCV_5015201 [Trichonephila clavipes]|nr:hypothetical protein TNCV_5015201 [Trichonephila clavipes]